MCSDILYIFWILSESIFWIFETYWRRWGGREGFSLAVFFCTPFVIVSVCVCVRVCERERERQREKGRESPFACHLDCLLIVALASCVSQRERGRSTYTCVCTGHDICIYTITDMRVYHICIYDMYIHINMHICNMLIHMDASRALHMYTNTQLHAVIYVYNIYIYIDICIYIYTYICMYIYTYIYIYIYNQGITCVYKHSHACCHICI